MNASLSGTPGRTAATPVLGVRDWFGWTFVISFASIFLVDVPMPLSRSGTLEVTYGDFVAAGLWAYVVFLLVSRRWRPTGIWRAVLIALGACVVCFIIVEVVRLLRGDEILQPVLVFRTTFLPVVALMALGCGIDKPARALNALVVFMATLTLWHLGEWNSMRMSDFLGNSIVYVGLAVMILPASVFVVASSRHEPPLLVRIAALVNVLAALVVPLWSGSRAVTGLAAMGVIYCFIVLLISRRSPMVLWATAGVALVLQVCIWWFNPMGGAYGMYRLVPPPGELFPSQSQSFRATLDQAQRETAVSEMAKSDAGRSELQRISLERVADDPLIGDGVVYFDVPGDGLDQEFAAHNLVLEHLNAFGAVGFVAYAAIFFAALWPALAAVFRRRKVGQAYWMALATVAIWFGFSLVQPTSLIMTIMVPFFAAIGGMMALSAEGGRDGRSETTPGRLP